jgi:transcription elongation factor Elf1
MAMVSTRSSGGIRKVTTYSCKICGEKFNTQLRAEEHIRTAHPQVFANAFECNMCHERFLTREEAEAHIRSVHPELLHEFGCRLCEETFATESDAQNHLRSVHPELYQVVDCPFCEERIPAIKVREHLKIEHPIELSELTAGNSSNAG